MGAGTGETERDGGPVVGAQGAAGAAAEPSCCAYARELVHGAIELEELPYSWVRPWRFSATRNSLSAGCIPLEKSLVPR